jgi:hypothetical protein
LKHESETRVRNNFTDFQTEIIVLDLTVTNVYLAGCVWSYIPTDRSFRGTEFVCNLGHGTRLTVDSNSAKFKYESLRSENSHKGKCIDKVHFRTGHEGPEGE